MPAVYNRHHGNAPHGAIYCGRGTPWGNPFKEGTRDQNCDDFEISVLPQLDVSALRGKDLICSCAPLRCHCDSILRKANRVLAPKLKLKGAYWHPDPLDYAGSIGGSSPPAWHKDHSNIISTRAAVAAMVYNVPIETYIRAHTDPFDFMLRAKVNRSDYLLIGTHEVQRVTRYYVSTDGQQMVKVSPPVAGGVIGQWKRANGVTKAEYEAEMERTGGDWSESVCTKNRSKYTERRTMIQAGRLVTECNDASTFQWYNVDYSYYVAEAAKLVIA